MHYCAGSLSILRVSGNLEVLCITVHDPLGERGWVFIKSKKLRTLGDTCRTPVDPFQKYHKNTEGYI